MTFFTEVVFSGFVSKAVNNCVDVSWDKIKKAAENRKTKHKNLESQIYNVTVDVLNNITDKQFESNQDNIYNSAEVLLKSFINSEENELEHIKSCLQILCSNVDENKCIQFKILLYETLGKNEYSELFRIILLFLLEQNKQYDYDVHQQIIKKLDEVILVLNQKKDNENNNSKVKVKSRTQEYADKWDANMFLNDFNERDEKAGVNIRLKEIYLEKHLPHYIWKENAKESKDLKKLLNEYFNCKKNQMLLVLGQQGIGKSTLITWITANYTYQKDRMLVYQFASDLKDVNWNDVNSISDQLIGCLGLSDRELNGKILILDGYDEISVGCNRTSVLNSLYEEFVGGKLGSNISIIVTCRENYIQELNRIRSDYIILQSLDQKQINSFCRVYERKVGKKISYNTYSSIVKNRKILGIPLILYMVLALDLAIGKNGSIVDVYDQIFCLDGGIYDRCIKNISFAGPHWTGKIKNQIHLVSRMIAIWMFENNSEKACIPKKEFEKIYYNMTQEQLGLSSVMSQDILIGSFFKSVKHCDGIGTDEIYFVHRSIYEYFVAETIYDSIEKSLLEHSEESKVEFARNISIYLKDGILSNTIGSYLQYKIMKLYDGFNKKKRLEIYKWWESAVRLMMTNGMFYFVENQQFQNIMFKESRCFLNLISLLRRLRILNNHKNIMQEVDKELIETYIKYCSVLKNSLNGIDLSFVNMREIDLRGLDLMNVNLRCSDIRNAKLCETNLKRANLECAILTEADLRGADLREANLEYTNLKKTDMRGVILNESKSLDLFGKKYSEAILKNSFLENSIWLEKDVLPNCKQISLAFFFHIIVENEYGRKKIDKEHIYYMRRWSKN